MRGFTLTAIMAVGLVVCLAGIATAATNTATVTATVPAGCSITVGDVDFGTVTLDWNSLGPVDVSYTTNSGGGAITVCDQNGGLVGPSPADTATIPLDVAVADTPPAQGDGAWNTIQVCPTPVSLGNALVGNNSFNICLSADFTGAEAGGYDTILTFEILCP